MKWTRWITSKWGNRWNGQQQLRVQAAPKVKMPPARSQSWKKNGENTFSPSVSTDVFFRVLEHYMKNQDSEVSFRLYFNTEANQLEYTTGVLARGSGAHVSMDADQDKKGFDEAKAAGYICNTHGHTHPDFNAFFSGVDVAQQEDVMYTENLLFYPNGGTVYYLVVGHSGLSWLMRRLVWNKGDSGHEITYDDSFVELPTGLTLSKDLYEPKHTIVYHQAANNKAYTQGVLWVKDEEDETPWAPTLVNNGLDRARDEELHLPNLAAVDALEWDIWHSVSQMSKETLQDFLSETTQTSWQVLLRLSVAELIDECAEIIADMLLEPGNEYASAESIVFKIVADLYDVHDATAGESSPLMVDRMRAMLSKSDMYRDSNGVGMVDSFVTDVQDLLGISPEDLIDMESEWHEFLGYLEYWHNNDEGLTQAKREEEE